MPARKWTLSVGFMLSIIVVALPVSSVSSQFNFGPQQSASIRNPVSIAAGQKCAMFCWAASIQMVAKAQDIDIPQELIFTKVFGPYVRCLPSGNIQNIVNGVNGIYRRTDGSQVILQARAYYGNNGYAVPLIEAIRGNRPFIFLTQTHAMVAVGLTWSNVFNQFGQQVGVQIWSVDLIDPFFTFGAQEFVTFYMRPDTAGNISGAIDIFNIEVRR